MPRRFTKLLNKGRYFAKFRVLGIIAFAIWMPPFVPAQTPIDVDSLIREAAEDKQEGAFAGYSYKLEFVRRRRALLGTSTVTKRFEAVLPFVVPKKRRYSHPLLLTYDSSRNLSALDIISERRRLVKMLEEIEKNPDADAGNSDLSAGGYVALQATSSSTKKIIKIDLVELLQNSIFSNPKEIWLNGRATISLEFRPRPDSNYEYDLLYLQHIGGLLFVDKNDKRVVTVEGFPLGVLERMKTLPDNERELFSIFYYLQTRVPEGFWFPERVKLNFMHAPPEIGDLDVAVEFKFSDYSRSLVEVRSAKVDAPDEPELEN